MLSQTAVVRRPLESRLAIRLSRTRLACTTGTGSSLQCDVAIGAQAEHEIPKDSLTCQQTDQQHGTQGNGESML